MITPRVQLPKYNANDRLMISGAVLNDLMEEIRKRQPLAGEGLQSTQVPQGVILRVVRG